MATSVIGAESYRGGPTSRPIRPWRISMLATIRRRGPLAQLVEQGTLNPKVVGSIPTRPILAVACPARLVGLRGDTSCMSSAPIVANQLDVVLRNVADGITAQRADGSLAYANDAAARRRGLGSGEELIGLAGSELTRRFLMIGEDGDPLAPGQLPNRRALASG